METLAAFVANNGIAQTDLAFLAGYFPLGVIGVWRWSVWLFKKTISFFYRDPEGRYVASLSIVTPVYNEDPDMFRSALESWKANDPQEIIAVIDHTDARCIETFRAFSETFPGAKLMVTDTPGKRAALAEGIDAAISEIIALTDSDTVWTDGFREKILGPFEERRVGGVAPRQDVMGADTLAKKLFRIHIFNRYGNDLLFQAAFGDALSCISGRTGVYRRSAIAHLTAALTDETFLGKRCISGDDKRLTYLIQRDGWKVKYVRDALVYTPGFPDVKTYTKQQIRWTRNSWRADLTAVFSRWLWKNPFLAFHTVDRFFQPFTLLVGPIFFLIALYKGDWIVAGVLLAWWLASRAIKIARHLRAHPADVRILPAYVAYCYAIAVIKIYTLLTVDEQSWITRWDKDRLNPWNVFKEVPAYAATFAIVFLLSFVSYETHIRLAGAPSFYQKAQSEKIAAERRLYRVEDRSQLVAADEEEAVSAMGALYRKMTEDQFGYYQIAWGETLDDVKKRYLLPADAVVLAEDKGVLDGRVRVKAGDRIAIAVQDLRRPDLSLYRGQSQARVSVTQDFAENAVRIRGRGAFVTIAELGRMINNRAILENVGEKNWILRKNLFIDSGVTLIIDGADVEWLRLASGRRGFAWIKAEGGNLIINKTKITSWDEESGGYDTEWQDGRSYILQKSSGRMDINESELAYLGYPGLPNRGNPYGGPYGVSWKIHDDSFRKELSTGSLTRSSVHHNFFGVYTFGATGAVFSRNNVFDNVEYGIDPHDDSNNLLIEDNQVFRNGNHGIIASKRCFANIIRGNVSHDNRLHGIMLDRDSNNNLVENNVVSGNVNGIALYHSSENVIVNNSFMGNQFGIRANNFSKGNYFGYNAIGNSRKGVFLYQDSTDNHIFRNTFLNNGINVHLKRDSTGFFARAAEQ